MKKLIFIITAAVLIFTAVIFPAAAEEIIDQDSANKSGNINVSYNAEVSYTVTIPAGITFTESEKSIERGISANNVSLTEGSYLKINVASLNDFKMKNNNGYIDYTLTVNKTKIPDGNSHDILTVKAGESSGWAVLNFTTGLDRTNAFYAGTYTDTLTFTIYIE